MPSDVHGGRILEVEYKFAIGAQSVHSIQSLILSHVVQMQPYGTLCFCTSSDTIDNIHLLINASTQHRFNYSTAPSDVNS